jgi:hypothetical protein
MKRFLSFLLLFTLCATASAQSHRIVVERPAPPADTTQAVLDTLRRMVIDPGEMVYQMQVDSVNQAMEEKIRGLIGQMERKFEDPTVEEEVGRLIGEAVMEQQMALLDLQIQRAISVKDTLLLMGLQLALEKLLQNSDVIQEQITKQLDAMEKEMEKP